MDLEGVVPPMVTPIDSERYDVDERALGEYTEYLVSNGVHGLFPCGSTGEFASLTPEQRTRVIEVVAETAESVPVLAGCGDTSIPGVVSQIEAAAEAGADAAVVVTPYYLSGSESGLSAFYRRVADRSELPILVYHIPELTGQQLSVDGVIELADHDRIVGLKDTTRDLLRFQELVDRTSADFSLFQGATTLALPSLDAGADGLIPTSANVLPDTLASVYDAHAAGDRQRAADAMANVVVPFLTSFRSEPAISSVKFLVGERGPDVGPPLPPLPELSADQRARLRNDTMPLQSV